MPPLSGEGTKPQVTGGVLLYALTSLTFNFTAFFGIFRRLLGELWIFLM